MLVYVTKWLKDVHLPKPLPGQLVLKHPQKPLSCIITSKNPAIFKSGDNELARLAHEDREIRLFATQIRIKNQKQLELFN